MDCKNCGLGISSESVFCNKCGKRVEPEIPINLDQRISTIEAQIKGIEKKQTKEQYVVEIETAAKIAERIKKWITILLFYITVPTALIVGLLAYWLGPGIFDVKHFADNSKKKIDKMVGEAKKDIDKTELDIQNAKASVGQVDGQLAAMKINAKQVSDQVTA